MTSDKESDMGGDEELVFVDELPNRRTVPGAWPQRMNMLRANPDRWVDATATWGSRRSNSVTMAIKPHLTDHDDAKRFEVRQRTVDGITTVYVRYNTVSR